MLLWMSSNAFSIHRLFGVSHTSNSGSVTLGWVARESMSSARAVCAQYEGGVVVISHDSQLLSRVCDDAERSEVRTPVQWLGQLGLLSSKVA